MTVFKGYLLMAKKNIGTILMYFGIFTGITLILIGANGSSFEDTFKPQKLNIAVVDSDKSDLSKVVIQKLKREHKVQMSENNNEELYEKLYYGAASVVIKIPKGFERGEGKEDKAIELTEAPGSYSGIYLKQQINSYIENVCRYEKLGYSFWESVDKVDNTEKPKVIIAGKTSKKNDSKEYATLFAMVPYMLVSGLGAAVAVVIHKFRKEEVKKRMMASKVSLARQNIEALAAILVVGAMLYLVTIGFAVAKYGTDFLTTKYIGYYLLNLFIDAMLALAMAFAIGFLLEKEKTITMVFTSVSLAMSFLGGVFVPVEYLAPSVRVVAKFIPVYWFEVANNILMSYSKIEGNIKTQMWQALGIQSLFVVAILGIGLVIAKYKQQEK